MHTIDLVEDSHVNPESSMPSWYESRIQDGPVSGLHTIFKECAPTKERLAILRDGWTNEKYLLSRLLYCQPFNIVFLQEEQLVMKSHRELEEFLLDERSGSFITQVLLSWPETFGVLKNNADEPCSFQWNANASQLDDNIHLIFRVAARNEERRPLYALAPIATPGVIFYPGDNVLWQVMPKAHNSVLTMRTIAFLENLFAPTHGIDSLSSHGSLNDWFSIQTTTPVLRSTGYFGMGNWLCVQINLRACIPDEKNHRNKHFKGSWGISPRSVGLPLNRQIARIPDLSRNSNMAAVEYLLSVAMVLRKRTVNGCSAMKYDVVAWVDYDTNFGKPVDRGNIFPVLSNRVELDLGFEDCGAGGEPVVQFLIVLAKSIDHWKHCWDNMIDKQS
ncbi:hypothetical protein F5Y09DRAFT_327446 [Xylaria sp. FL1042]|nr:hypothetical protein F5Y09DRAFT_327446 [Xylaria sp. FL1042]